MRYVSLPTREELLQLVKMQSDACLSIYLEVTPITQNTDASRIMLENMLKEAYGTLHAQGFDKHRLSMLEESIAAVIEQEGFWTFHANTLVLLATPDCLRLYRLANKLENRMKVGDRFYLKPLFRAVTFSHSAYILALSENEARVVEVFAEGEPEVLDIPNMPKDALEAIGRSSINTSTGSLADEAGSRGPKMRLTQYARKVNQALRPVLLDSSAPLVLVSTEPLGPIFRSVCSYPHLLDKMVYASPDRLSVTELEGMARPLVHQHNADELVAVKKLFEERAGQRRVAKDLAAVARAATFGMVSLLLVDFDKKEKGFVDEGGTICFSKEHGAYDLIDFVTKKAFASGAKIMAVRSEEMLGDSGVAAILRYPMMQD